MKTHKKNLPIAPASIQLLFNNEKLDLMKVLCLMNAFSMKSNKQRKVEEIVFYYSLVNFGLINLLDSNSNEKNGTMPSPNLYFRFQTKINRILLNMSHLKFIEIKGDISKKLDTLNIKLLAHGEEFYEENKSIYLKELQADYLNVFDKVVYSKENVKVIKGLKL